MRGRSTSAQPRHTLLDNARMASTVTALPAADDTPWWRGFLRRGLINQMVCVIIAVALWLMSPGRPSFVGQWVYSVAIGTACWFFIDGSRMLLSTWLVRHAPDNPALRSRWPGLAWMVICILVGTIAGYSLGSQIGDMVTGFSTPSLLQNRPAIVISLIAAIGATFFFYANERLHQEQAAAEAARRLAAESQLKLIESQLEPHMLFNTLANLRVLIGLDSARAQAMLDHLIAYLRATLSASRAARHPLAAEFDRVADYLALLAIRMGPRLEVEIVLPDELRVLPVPPLLLQPLVENCIHHGLEPKVAGGRIELRARREGSSLQLTVRDTGVGLADAPASQGTGFGTTQVRERLAALFGDRASFTLVAATDAEGGAIATITLPLTEAAA
jgi:signal transduction histidine kinase